MTPRRDQVDDAEPSRGAPSSDADASTKSREADALDPEKLAAERDQYLDLLRRKTAEFDNYRKRVERERGELNEFAAADVLTEILPVLDNLERALSAAADTSSADAYRQGVELIYQQLLEVLRKRGVTAIDAVGEEFDPHVHHAVSQERSSEHRDGEVIEELRRGYRLGDRLLRPALVKVASGD
jgi:molecular chaperone GrpE